MKIADTLQRLRGPSAPRPPQAAVSKPVPVMATSSSPAVVQAQKRPFEAAAEAAVSPAQKPKWPTTPFAERHNPAVSTPAHLITKLETAASSTPEGDHVPHRASTETVVSAPTSSSSDQELIPPSTNVLNSSRFIRPFKPQQKPSAVQSSHQEPVRHAILQSTALPRRQLPLEHEPLNVTPGGDGLPPRPAPAAPPGRLPQQIPVVPPTRREVPVTTQRPIHVSQPPTSVPLPQNIQAGSTAAPQVRSSLPSFLVIAGIAAVAGILWYKFREQKERQISR